MRSLIYLFFLTLLVSSCRTLIRKSLVADEKLFKIREGSFIGNSETIEVYFQDGSIKAKGQYAFNRDAELSNLKVREWISYFENGQIKSRGSYDVGSYIQCCFAGHCRQFYSFKVGYWEYFHTNGQLKAKGKYQTQKLHIDTSCEGGDEMPFGLVTSEWKYFNDEGGEVKATDEFMSELETVSLGDSIQIFYLFPDSKKENIRFGRIE